MSRGARPLALLLLLPADAARAHHGVASGGFAGVEGPGAAIETTSALPLPERGLLLFAKEELARFRHLDRAEPLNKDHLSFTTLGAGIGIRPWLSAYLFAPYAVKAQDGLGTSAGLGDPTLLLQLATKWDEGLRLVPEKESLDELADWHFSAWACASAPLGSVSRKDAQGDFFEPEMQTGFGAPSAMVGAAVLKQLAPSLTVLADASHQRFLPHTYSFTRYQFGAETRVNAAASWRTIGRPDLRLDAVAELNGMWLERDHEREPGGSGLEPLRASGGGILYMGVGARVTLGRLGVAAGLRRSVATALNEGFEQQGSEGLENFRATVVVTWALEL